MVAKDDFPILKLPLQWLFQTLTVSKGLSFFSSQCGLKCLFFRAYSSLLNLIVLVLKHSPVWPLGAPPSWCPCPVTCLQCGF